MTHEAGLLAEEIAFVFDFGGGTLDFSVIRIGPQRRSQTDRREDILAVGGVVIGGNTFDEDIMEKRLIKYFGSRYVGKTMTGGAVRLPLWILAQLRSWYALPLLNEQRTIQVIQELAGMAKRGRRDLLALLTLVQRNYGWELFQEIERTKIALSEVLDTRLVFGRENIQIKEQISRANFETMIAPRLRVIDEEIDRTIKMAGLTAEDIDVVLRTGGSSLIPAIQAMLENKFTGKVIKQDVFTSVVSGLALAGDSKFL